MDLMCTRSIILTEREKKKGKKTEISLYILATKHPQPKKEKEAPPSIGIVGKSNFLFLSIQEATSISSLDIGKTALPQILIVSVVKLIFSSYTVVAKQHNVQPKLPPL